MDLAPYEIFYAKICNFMHGWYPKNSYTIVYSPVQERIHWLKLVDYLLIQLDNPWYNYYIAKIACASHIIWFNILFQNIFLTSTGRVQLGDFGIAKVLNR